MVFYFKYKQFSLPDGTKIQVPKIPVVLVGNETKLNVLGLVDSGSTQCTIPKELAEILGLKFLGSEVEISTLDRKVNGWESKMKIIVEMPHGRKELSVPVVVVDHLDEIILGREKFFDSFEIVFKEAEKKIGLKPARAPSA